MNCAYDRHVSLYRSISESMRQLSYVSLSLFVRGLAAKMIVNDKAMSCLHGGETAYATGPGQQRL
jgi:hypothetical protein